MIRKIALIFFLTASLFGADATIEIVKDIEKRLKIAIFDTTGYEAQISKKLFKMMAADFKTTGHFLVDETYQRDSASVDPKYKNYDYLLRYSIDNGSRLNINVKVYKAGNDELVANKSFYIGSEVRYPFLAHNVVKSINDYFGFPSVEWMTNFVIFSKYTGKKQADIYISDYTLTYQKMVVGGGLNIFPKWANGENEAFYYTSYNGRIPTLYRVDLYTGQREEIMSNEGMLVCSDSSDDGSRLLLTLAKNDQPEVYLYNTQTKRKKRLTYYAGIDVNAQFLNDGRFAFVSDRLGYPNIYSKSLEGSSVEQLVYHGKNNNALTANGKYMVYSSRDTQNSFSTNTFNLYLISQDSSYIRPLTATGVNQFPRFSKNGETVLFIKHFKNESALGIIRLNENRSYLFPLRGQKIQSIDW